MFNYLSAWFGEPGSLIDVLGTQEQSAIDDLAVAKSGMSARFIGASGALRHLR
jgi:hypothetical protein